MELNDPCLACLPNGMFVALFVHILRLSPTHQELELHCNTMTSSIMLLDCAQARAG